ncbi:hypothetical protein R1flu_005374 [Riccia fluitans]|uniref:Reverse transcriptase zinc-binding domain-containing protein n=1 Tax=Riccia fluitans TaxID=41844 RepID=A0ABD1YTT1_9MARC
MEHKRVYRYLGAPIGSGLKHDQLISFCLDRMVSRLNLWSNRLLSFKARVILIKHVLLTIPIFYLSAIDITKKVVETIEKIAAHFLWGKTKDGKNKRGLIPWPALKWEKHFGGLGFKDVWRQGVALFSKHMGDFFADSNKAQWHNLLDAFIDGQRAKRSGSIIRSSYRSQELLLLRRPMHPGKSNMAKALLTSWTITTKDLRWSPASALIPDHLTLRDLLALTMQADKLPNHSLKEIMAELRAKGVTTVLQLWQKKERLLTNDRLRLGSNSINFIRRILRAKGLAMVKLHRTGGWKWKKGDPVLKFNRSSAQLYKVTKPKEDWAREINRKWGLDDKGIVWNRRWKLIWHPQVHLKDATFVWRMLWQGLYTATKALRFGFGDGSCPVCKQNNESVDHLFLLCSCLNRFWMEMCKDKLLPLGSNISIFKNSLPAFIDAVLGPVPTSIAKWKVLIELWRQIWLSRNKLVYEGKGVDTTVWLCARLA